MEIVDRLRNTFVFIVLLRTIAFYKMHVLKLVTCQTCQIILELVQNTLIDIKRSPQSFREKFILSANNKHLHGWNTLSKLQGSTAQTLLSFVFYNTFFMKWCLQFNLSSQRCQATQQTHDVVVTFMRLLYDVATSYRRLIHVETTSCVYGEVALHSFLLYIHLNSPVSLLRLYF